MMEGRYHSTGLMLSGDRDQCVKMGQDQVLLVLNEASLSSSDYCGYYLQNIMSCHRNWIKREITASAGFV